MPRGISKNQPIIKKEDLEKYLKNGLNNKKIGIILNRNEWTISRYITKFGLNNIKRKHHLKGKTYEERYGERTLEIKRKIGLKSIGRNKGENHPNKKLEIRKKISDSNKGRLSIFKGKTYQEIYGNKWKKQIEKRSIARIKYYDKKGRNNESRNKHCGIEYKNWRALVFQRDNWICQTCFIRGGILNAHHIKSWKNYSELRYNINNGITLCIECHKLAHKIQRKLKK